MILLINRKPHVTLDELLKEFPKAFKSLDYLEGFCDGYLFGEYRLVSPEQFAKTFNSVGFSAGLYWIVFPVILPPADVEN